MRSIGGMLLFILSYGVPIVIAFYLIFVFDSKLNKLIELLNSIAKGKNSE